jgi:hypothetical protein
MEYCEKYCAIDSNISPKLTIQKKYNISRNPARRLLVGRQGKGGFAKSQRGKNAKIIFHAKTQRREEERTQR